MLNPVEGTSGSARVFDGVYNETDGYAPSLERVQAREGSAITKLSEPLDETTLTDATSFREIDNV